MGQYRGELQREIVILFAKIPSMQRYFSFLIRRLGRNKTYTLLNVVGLAVGIAACLLIFLLVRFELSFDDFHSNPDRIYRLVSVPYRIGSPLGASAGVPLPVARALRADLPAAERVAAIFGRDGQVTAGREKKFQEEGGVYYAEPDFFRIFNFRWLEGGPSTLESPNTVALTRETASRYFGDWRGAVGKSIQFDNKDLFRVTGILEDIPANTDFPLKVVLSYSSLKNVDLMDWQGTYGRGYTFVRLAPGTGAARFDEALRELVNRHTPRGLERRGIVAQPLAEMHRDGRYGNFSGRTFSGELIRSLILTAIFLLVIACVNFINLSTVQAVKRSRETGIRKVLGSGRRQLMWHFIGEAGFYTLLAIVLAVGAAAMVLPYLNGLLRLDLRLGFENWGVWAFLGILAVTTSAMAGIYPALVISGIRPVKAIRNEVTIKGISLRRGLVVLQFCIAQVLVVCVLVVSSQMNFFRQVSLGFDQSSIVNVPIPNDSVSLRKMEHVRKQLLAQPGIERVSFSTFSPLDNEIWSNQFKFDHSATKTNFQAFFKWADADFFSTYRPELIAGHVYGPSDTLQEYVVNETLVHQLGFRDPKEILGKEINIWDQLRGPVVGVVRDFYTNSMQKPIAPIVMGCWKDSYAMAGIRLKAAGAGAGPAGGEKAENTAATLAAIERIWNAAYPDYVYSYQFLDEKINGYYEGEGQLSRLYRLFAAIAILISCLGLYGLVSFMAVQRTKEIGVRKVLGASVMDVVVLLSGELTLLVGIAFVVAAPLGFWVMHRWLEGFAYRVSPGIGLFVAALAISVILSWVTVGYRAFRAAAANPIRALRSEGRDWP